MATPSLDLRLSLGALACLASLACNRPSPPGASLAASASAPAPLAPAPAASTAPSPAPPQGTPLYGWGRVNQAFLAEKVASGGADPLVKRLFPRSLPGVDACPPDPGSTEQALARGFIVPRVERRVTGTFVSGAEALNEVLVGECGATHAIGWGSRRLVLVRAGEVVVDAPLEGRLAGAGDLDGDGVSEALIEGGGTSQGITTHTLKIVRLTPEGPVEVRDLGVVYQGNCGSRAPDGEEVAMVWARKGASGLEIDTRRERRACEPRAR